MLYYKAYTNIKEGDPIRARDSFRKGAVEMVLLSVLMDGDLYGYEMSKLIAQRSDGAFTVAEGSMYPALYRLEDNGYVSSKRELVSKRMTRVYYHLEEKGRDYYDNLKKEYFMVTGSVTKLLRYHEREEGEP